MADQEGPRGRTYRDIDGHCIGYRTQKRADPGSRCLRCGEAEADHAPNPGPEFPEPATPPAEELPSFAEQAASVASGLSGIAAMLQDQPPAEGLGPVVMTANYCPNPDCRQVWVYNSRISASCPHCNGEHLPMAPCTVVPTGPDSPYVVVDTRTLLFGTYYCPKCVNVSVEVNDYWKCVNCRSDTIHCRLLPSSELEPEAESEEP